MLSSDLPILCLSFVCQMVKAVVKTMDAVQQFAGTLKNVPEITGFVVAGASKRGWTTWLTPAVDKRVIAIIPIVLDVLNLVKNINHHWQAYGSAFVLGVSV